jgi:acyl-coenzyme A thioesterase PaaI-like protein
MAKVVGIAGLPTLGNRMSDLPPPGPSVPARIGVTAHVVGDDLRLALEPNEHHLVHGRVRACVHTFLVDLIAGLRINAGNDSWMLTTDLSVRARPEPAPRRLEARAIALRQGRRGATWSVDVDEPGGHAASGAASFITLDRREGDPPKPDTSAAAAMARFTVDGARLSAPIREEADIESVDPAQGVVEVEVTSQVLNTNGTMQGAMVALVAESAAEDLVQTRFGVRAVVTDLDLRYLNRVEHGRLRTSCRLLGDRPDATVEVTIRDIERDRITTLVYARASVLD